MDLQSVLMMPPCADIIVAILGTHFMRLSSVDKRMRKFYLSQKFYKPPLYMVVMQEMFFPITPSSIRNTTVKEDKRWSNDYFVDKNQLTIRNKKILKIASPDLMWQPICQAYLDITTPMTHVSDRERANCMRMALLRYRRSSFEDKYDVYYCRCIVEALSKIDKYFDLTITYCHGPQQISHTYNKDFGYYIVEAVDNYHSVPVFFYVNSNSTPIKVAKGFDQWSMLF